MRRDRYGDLVDQEPVDEHQALNEHQAAVLNRHHCDNGWVDRDADHPIPCLHCRPHLTPQPRPPEPDPARIQAGLQRCRAALADRGHQHQGTHQTGDGAHAHR